jgi:TatD DNase family protein
VIAMAFAMDIHLVSSGVNRDSSLRTLDIAQENPQAMRVFVGTHPSNAPKEPDVSWLRRALDTAAGVGEIGLDPKYSSVDEGGAQSRVFEAQLVEAEKAGKPIQVHSRGAEERCLQALSGFSLKSVLMHWFQSQELASIVSDRGYFVSFGPSLLYSKRLRKMAGGLEKSLVLTETDAPVPYQPLGGAQGPPLIPSVVFALARLWRVGFEEARMTILSNGLRYLGVSEKG